MSRRTDPLSLDPLSPIRRGRIEDMSSMASPLALDPLSPVPPSARRAPGPAARGLPRFEDGLTRDSTRHSPRRDRPRPGSKVTT